MIVNDSRKILMCVVWNYHTVILINDDLRKILATRILKVHFKVLKIEIMYENCIYQFVSQTFDIFF